MSRYRWDGSQWVDKSTGEPMEAPNRLAVPVIRSDIEGYLSPISGKLISGRAAQRDDLKRAGCRLAEPSEAPTVCRTEKWAKRLRLDREDLSAKRLRDQ
jgi:hypothetical protein